MVLSIVSGIGLMVLSVISGMLTNKRLGKIITLVAICAFFVLAVIGGYTGNTSLLALVNVKTSNFEVSSIATFFVLLVVYGGLRTLVTLLMNGKGILPGFLGGASVVDTSNSNTADKTNNLFIRRVLRDWLVAMPQIRAGMEQVRTLHRTNNKMFVTRAVQLNQLTLERQVVPDVRRVLKVEKDTDFKFVVVDVAEVDNPDEFFGLPNGCQALAKKVVSKQANRSGIQDNRVCASRSNRIVARRIENVVVLLIGSKQFDTSVAEDVLDLLANEIVSLL